MALREIPAATARAVTPMHVGLPSHRPLVHAPVVLEGRDTRAPDIKLVVHQVDSLQTASVAVMPNETISDIRVRLANNGWFKNAQAIVFGDRELADSVRVTDLVSASGKTHPSYLHVFVKLSDVESVDIRTMMRELRLSNPAVAESQLSAALAGPSSNLLALPRTLGGMAAAIDLGIDNSESADSSSGSSAFAAAAAAATAVSSSSSSSDGRAVVHLMVHKSAKVNWHHMQENRFELSITSSETVDSLMRKIEAANGIALEPSTVLIDGQPLASGQPLAAYGISKGSKLELVPCEPEAFEDDALPDGSPSLTSPAHQLHRHWQAARAGLAEGLAPTLAKAGTGGSYFLQDVNGKPVAVFKPEDEEPLAVNNPKGRTPGSSSDISSGSSSGSEGLRRGTKPGEGAAREVAAYVLDHQHFAGVPPTALVSAFVDSPEGGAVKVGSLQQFVESEGDCEERGYSSFPVQEVHKIAVLDLHLGNADRNGGNILVRRSSATSKWELIPIDHGYCLPASFEDLSFEWMYWPQAEQPFSKETLQYIANLDAERDESILHAHGIHLRPECLRVFRVCTMVLQKGAKAGLTPYQIAGILCREGLTKSVVEKLHSNAMQMAKAASSVGSSRSKAKLTLYMQHMEQLLDEYLEEYLLEGAELMY